MLLGDRHAPELAGSTGRTPWWEQKVHAGRTQAHWLSTPCLTADSLDPSAATAHGPKWPLSVPSHTGLQGFLAPLPSSPALWTSTLLFLPVPVSGVRRPGPPRPRVSGPTARGRQQGTGAPLHLGAIAGCKVPLHQPAVPEILSRLEGIGLHQSQELCPSSLYRLGAQSWGPTLCRSPGANKQLLHSLLQHTLPQSSGGDTPPRLCCTCFSRRDRPAPRPYPWAPSVARGQQMP